MDIRHAVGVKVGVPEAKLGALASYRDSAHFDPREKAALDFCERLTRDDGEVTDACFATLRAHFSEAEVVELAFVVGYQIMASKFAKAFDLAPQGFAA